ncbi:MAG: LysR substrate-binding domain-containing protein [Actinomycetota bacterium]
MKSAAFFDLDRTLLTGASGPVFSEGMRRAGLVDRTVPGERALFEIFNRIGETLPSMLLARQAATLAKGQKRSEVRKVARSVAPTLRDMVPPFAAAEIEEHRRAGRLLVMATTGRWLMPQFLTRLAQNYPDVRPLISEGGTSSLLPRLLSGHLDAAIVHLPVEEPELQVEPLFAEDLVLLVHARHPLHGRRRVSIADLAEHPLLLPPPSAALRRIINRSADEHHVTLGVQAEIDGVRLMASLAFEGFGAAIVPATAVPVWLSGNFSTITVPDLPRRVVGWVQRRRPGPTAVTRACLDIARAVIQRREGRQPGLHVGAESLPVH